MDEATHLSWVFTALCKLRRKQNIPSSAIYTHTHTYDMIYINHVAQSDAGWLKWWLWSITSIPSKSDSGSCHLQNRRLSYISKRHHHVMFHHFWIQTPFHFCFPLCSEGERRAFRKYFKMYHQLSIFKTVYVCVWSSFYYEVKFLWGKKRD